MQEHTEILETTPAPGSAQLPSAQTAGVAAGHATATSYDPYAGRMARSARLALGWFLARTIWLIAGESRSARVETVGSEQTRVR
jgi:hypothetical protein